MNKIIIDKQTAIKAICKLFDIDLVDVSNLDSTKHIVPNNIIEFDFECNQSLFLCKRKINIYWFQELMKLLHSVKTSQGVCSFEDMIPENVKNKYEEWKKENEKS